MDWRRDRTCRQNPFRRDFNGSRITQIAVDVPRESWPAVAVASTGPDTLLPDRDGRVPPQLPADRSQRQIGEVPVIRVQVAIRAFSQRLVSWTVSNGGRPVALRAGSLSDGLQGQLYGSWFSC